MTTLYKPVLIETAEQAEALPRGSVVFDGDPEDGDTYVRVGGDWYTNGYPGLLSEAVALGFTVTALVPTVTTLVPTDAEVEAAANALADWDGADRHAETWDGEIPREAYRAGARYALSAARAVGRGAR